MSQIPTVPSVLVTTDFSELANRAIPQAYAAVDDGGTVHLVHVLALVEPLGEPNPLYAHYTPGRAPNAEERRKLQEALATRLRELVPAGAGARRIRTEVDVVEGAEVAQAIVEAAERLGVALVCLGSHGHTGVAKLLLGNVAHAVLAKSPCPVLIVPAPRKG